MIDDAFSTGHMVILAPKLRGFIFVDTQSLSWKIAYNLCISDFARFEVANAVRQKNVVSVRNRPYGHMAIGPHVYIVISYGLYRYISPLKYPVKVEYWQNISNLYSITWPLFGVQYFIYCLGSSQYGCLWKDNWKCITLAKKLDLSDHSVRNWEQKRSEGIFSFFLLCSHDIFWDTLLITHKTVILCVLYVP